jgi:hypothetical protein
MDGEGAGVRVLAYEVPADPRTKWNTILLDSSMHLTHNFDVVVENGQESLLIGGKEGAKLIRHRDGKWLEPEWLIRDYGFSEIRQKNGLTAGIQPMHGKTLALYTDYGKRLILSDSLNQGHGLAIADMLGLGYDQVLAGWRNPNERGDTGIKLFVPEDREYLEWKSIWIDRNSMACEDLKVADLDGDGDQDIIASGRSTRNLVIYWNRSNISKD